MDIYLDIETSFRSQITVIGLYRKDFGFRQLMGHQITRTNLRGLLEATDRIVTYNGSRFDLPMIRKRLRLDLKEEFESYDLMLLCWRLKLYGGLKIVEQKLGIARSLTDIDGFEAMRLWDWYKRFGDERSLGRLLEYNREDVMNLRQLQRRLELILCGAGSAGDRPGAHKQGRSVPLRTVPLGTVPKRTVPIAS